MTRLPFGIYRASRENNYAKIRTLQTLLPRSVQAKLLAVRRVTMENQGQPKVGKMIKQNWPLERKGWRWYAPENSKARPPCLYVGCGDQKSQVGRRKPTGNTYIYKAPGEASFGRNGLRTPEWEARFEPNSYLLIRPLW